MTRENSPIALDWRRSSFDELSTSELYAILKLRQEVFVVEQKCVYLDCDGLDKKAWHLMGIDSTDTQYPLAAYLRVVFPGITTDYPTVGRLLTHKNNRRKGVARQLLQEAIIHINRIYPDSPIQLSAQLYLESFYKSFGFISTFEPYDEDGIPHIEMIKHS